MENFVVISGCSGGGKSTLLAELARRGHAVVEEPGRRIVSDELARGGSALPWRDIEAFAHRAVALALEDRRAAPAHGWVFFDRGLVDAAVALSYVTGSGLDLSLLSENRYFRRVFLAPPWPEIYETDGERRHDLDAGIAEYERLAAAYPNLGYEVVILPRISVPKRADLVIKVLEADLFSS